MSNSGERTRRLHIITICSIIPNEQRCREYSFQATKVPCHKKPKADTQSVVIPN
ncbi:hypothetical protein BDV27DRAFT_125900 [Aspergillus caelatus]|uniref:Uncharacterized protein n=1 Tax=Aspergillus caelatus TaxID=61420 RepID=A0A5N7A8Q4_9EURO|nr:uncharacterized protein BDV27DRAFT_125900 [Aspergillus caelatus]KAE8366023.1 hypothetical protein BDV27DRAFT_125900 [Aspergillus caelatus]